MKAVHKAFIRELHNSSFSFVTTVILRMPYYLLLIAHKSMKMNLIIYTQTHFKNHLLWTAICSKDSNVDGNDGDNNTEKCYRRKLAHKLDT